MPFSKKLPLRIAVLAALVLTTVSTNAFAAREMVAPGSPLTPATNMFHKAPAGVPDDYVMTPNGYFHPSCVRSVESGAKLEQDNSIRHADGSVDAPFICTYPHYLRDGTRKDADLSPFINGNKNDNPAAVRAAGVSWDAWAGNWVYPGVSLVYAEWGVNSAPPDAFGQVIFFYPGVEPLSYSVILQPVLGFNGFPNYPNQWTIASWVCCPGGVETYSTPVIVHPGEVLQGDYYSTAGEFQNTYSTATCNRTTGVCPYGAITTATMDGSAVTTLYIGNNTVAFPYVVGGTLETYYTNNCLEYPGTGAETFFNIQVRDTSGAPVTTGWYPGVNSSEIKCGFNINFGSQGTGHEPSIAIDWKL